MKRMLIFSILAGTCAIASAQYDEVYSDFNTKPAQAQYIGTVESEPQTQAPASSTRDVDEYNRRYTTGADTYLESDSVQEDFANSKKIVKYYNSDAVTINDPQYVYIYNNGEDEDSEDVSDQGSEGDNISAFMAGYSAGLFNGWWFDWYCPGYYIYPHRYAYYRWYDPWWYHPYHPWHVWHPYHPHYYRPYHYAHHPRPYRHMPAAYGHGSGRAHASRDFGMGARQDLKPHTTVHNASTRSTQQPGTVNRTGSSSRGQGMQPRPAAGNRSTSGSRPQGVYNSGSSSRSSAGSYRSGSSSHSSAGSYRSGSSSRSSGGYSGGSSSRSSFGGGSSYRSSGGYSGGSSHSSGGFSGGSSGRSSGSFGGSRGGSSSRGR